MRLEVVHRTRYRYAAPVRDSFNELRVRPVSNARQECESFLLRVLPPVRLRHYLDLHGNHVSFFDLVEPHQSLEIECRSRVRTSGAEPPAETGFPLARAAECARMESCHEFLQESRYVDLPPESWRLALDAAPARTTCGARRCGSCASSTASSPTARARPRSRHGPGRRSARRGVCQDFAHVMIALCRSLAIPTLYVSGYLYNGPRELLRGAQASHAWCEVYVPGTGWCGLDPTNDQPAGERYVKLAIGRDYADVAPVQGRYRGTAEQRLEVEVDVQRLDP